MRVGVGGGGEMGDVSIKGEDSDEGTVAGCLGGSFRGMEVENRKGLSRHQIAERRRGGEEERRRRGKEERRRGGKGNASSKSM